jgi:hypothetical protein
MAAIFWPGFHGAGGSAQKNDLLKGAQARWVTDSKAAGELDGVLDGF